MKLPVNFIKVDALAKGDSDYSFILSSWLKNYLTSEFANHIPKEIFFKSHERVIDELLQTSDLIFAVNPEDPDQILGYVCFKKTPGWFITHFLYVKRPFRRFGLGWNLLKAAGFEPGKPHFTSHRTRGFECLSRKHEAPYVYNPYYIFRGETNNGATRVC